jgi:hypothetical protein
MVCRGFREAEGWILRIRREHVGFGQRRAGWDTAGWRLAGSRSDDSAERTSAGSIGGTIKVVITAIPTTTE